MTPWELKIRKAENGYTLSWLDETDDGLPIPRQAVVQEDEQHENPEAQAAADMLWQVLEFFNILGSKHDKHRVRVKIEHGHGYECTGCEVCKE